MTIEDTILLQLTAAGMGNQPEFRMPERVDWVEVFNKSEEQNINGIIADGINNIRKTTGIQVLASLTPKEEYRKLQWFGQIFATEQDYGAYTKAICELSGLLRQHGIKMMILKGYGCSQKYPIPCHRACGDIDIYLNYADDAKTRGDIVNKANNIFHQFLQINLDRDSHHHSQFKLGGIGIENHVTILDIDTHKSSGTLEVLLEELADECMKKDLPECSYYLPSTKFNSIHLLRHMANDFATVRMSLRQILDWATMVTHAYRIGDMDWDFVHRVAHEHNMHRFLDMVNMICTDFLRYPKERFPVEKRNDVLCQRVINDIMHPDTNFQKSDCRSSFAYYLAKTKRLIANKWKYDMVYNENMFEYLLAKIKQEINKTALT